MKTKRKKTDQVRKQMTEEERIRIRELHQQGLSNKEIMRIMKRSDYTVSTVLTGKKYQKPAKVVKSDLFDVDAYFANNWAV